MSESVPPADWLEAANLHATVAQLLSTVIHQVNNALQTIGGHAELLKSDPGVSETTKRRANTITGVTDRTAEMLASFQVFTRPPAGEAIHDLRDVAARALAFRHYGLGRARIQASIEGIDRAPVRGEARPLMQAVLNVILNAEQAMASRGPDGTLTIVLGQTDGTVTLTVDDSGPGMPARADSSVPFRNAGTAGSRESWSLGPNNRLGLGLSTATAIVSRLGGAVSVSASPAGETHVRIALPAAAASE